MSDGRAQISLGVAFGAWIAAWLLGGLVGGTVQAAGEGDSSHGVTWLAVGALISWAALVATTVVLGQRFGRGDLRVDYGLSFKPVDLLGVPIGVFTQLVLLPVVYAPLRHWWPDTFSTTQLEQRARETWDRAGGAGLVVLVAIVVVGAPLVEELVYRGLLQGALVRRLGGVTGWILAAGLFAVIHPRAIEFPGLFVVGLVFGGLALRTGRLGMSVAAHLAFNAAGLVLVSR